jgi:sec-independent protein translocase protein TatA
MVESKIILNDEEHNMGLSFGHMALLLVVVLVVFGAGKLPNVMRDLAKGIRAFKEGMNENETKKKDDDTAV